MEKSTLTKFHDTIGELKHALLADISFIDTLKQCMQEREDYWVCHINKLVMEQANLQDKLDDASQMINDIHKELHETLNENSRLQSQIDAMLSDAYRYRALVDHFMHAENKNYDPADPDTVCDSCIICKDRKIPVDKCDNYIKQPEE